MSSADSIARFLGLMVGLEERVPGAVGIVMKKSPQDCLGLLSLKRVTHRLTETARRMPHSRREYQEEEVQHSNPLHLLVSLSSLNMIDSIFLSI